MPGPTEGVGTMAGPGDGATGLRPLIRLRLPASRPAVRAALRDVGATLARFGLDQEVRSVTELVLAEALNNVVEHAYRDGDGDIALDLDLVACGLAVTLRDKGRSLPDGRLPAGTLPAIGPDRDSLPEGGFGWYIIRSLSSRLSYHSAAGRNTLRLSIPFDRAGHA